MNGSTESTYAYDDGFIRRHFGSSQFQLLFPLDTLSENVSFCVIASNKLVFLWTQLLNFICHVLELLFDRLSTTLISACH
jgi:hypothetical protein